MKSSQRIYANAIVIIILVLFANTTVIFTPAQSSFSYDDKERSSLSFVNQDSMDTFFDQRISFLMKLAGFPSLSACIIKDDTLVWSNSYGYYNLSGQKPASSETIYLLASITKTIVGTALLQLYEQGLFNLDDDVNLFLPFDLSNPHFPDDVITFRMLLSHTSSLNINTQMEYYWFNFSGDPPFDFFPEPYLREFLRPHGRYYDESIWSSRHRPGEQAMYANVGFDLIMYLVELISGESFLEYCDMNIFYPLKMYNTSFNLSTLDIDNVAIPYQRIFGKYYMINELDFLFHDYTPPERYWKMRSYPAGGLYSTVSDLSNFLIAHMNGGACQDVRILEEETVQLMHEMQPGNTIGYGLAWMNMPIGRSIVASGHGGDIYGIDTWMLYSERDDIGVIYLANGNPAYGFLPLRGWIITQLILYLLFTKEGYLSYEHQQENDIPKTFLNTSLPPFEWSWKQESRLITS